MSDDGLTAGAVARRLGVAVTTLRTWHQRYGLGPSKHTPGQHRRYTPDDLARLDMMRRLTTQGDTPAEAAAWARRVDIAPGTAAFEPPPPPNGLVRTDHDHQHRNTRDGGGNTIPVGGAGPAARGLARAAVRLDAPAMREILRTVVRAHGVVRAWQSVILPVLIGVGQRHATTQRFIDVEHLLSRTITETFAQHGRTHVNGAPPHVLLACADEEQHTLPMEALAAALAEHGVPTRLLGARVPPRALKDAVSRTGPTAVVVWSHARGTADPAQLTQLTTGSWRPVLVAGAGPGWSAATLPPEIPVLADLSAAVTAVRAAVPPTA